MQMRALAGEEGSEGQWGAVEEVVEPQAEIDSGELGGAAGQEAVGGAGTREGEAQGVGQLSIDGLDDLAGFPRTRRDRLRARCPRSQGEGVPPVHAG